MEALSSSKYESNVIDHFGCIIPELHNQLIKYLFDSRSEEGVTQSNQNTKQASLPNIKNVLSTILGLSLKLFGRNILTNCQIIDLLRWIFHYELHSIFWDPGLLLIFLKLVAEILLVDPSKFSGHDLSQLVKCFSSEYEEVRWQIWRIFGIWLKVADLGSFLKSQFISGKYSELNSINFPVVLPQKAPIISQNDILVVDVSHKDQTLCADDFNGNFIPLFNMLFKRYKNEPSSLSISPKFVLLNTWTSYLQSLAHATLTGSPVLLSGPMGCGKTSVLEYFAACLERNTSRELLKLQLGDQTDAKVSGIVVKMMIIRYRKSIIYDDRHCQFSQFL